MANRGAVIIVGAFLVMTTGTQSSGATAAITQASCHQDAAAPAESALAQACALAEAGLDDAAEERAQAAVTANPEVQLPIELVQLVELQRIRRLAAGDHLDAARTALYCLLPSRTRPRAVPQAKQPACRAQPVALLSAVPLDLEILVNPYVESERLIELGRRDDARTAAKETLARFPGTPVPASVSSLLKQDNPWYVSWPRQVEPVFEGALTVLKFVALVVLVAFVVAALVLRGAGRRGRRALEFIPGLGWFLHLRVSVPPPQVGDAPHLNPSGLAAVAAARLASTGTDDPSIEIVRDSSTATGLVASLGDVSPLLAVLGGAGRWLLPGRTVTFEAYLHSSESSGAVERITVNLNDPGGFYRGTTTLAVDMLETEGSAAMALIERGADWVAFSLDPLSASSPVFASHAEFLEGVRQEQVGNPERALDHYRRALDMDPANHAAALNLYGRPMLDRSAFRLDKLASLRPQIDETGVRHGRLRLSSHDPPNWDYPIWYQLRYVELVVGLNSTPVPGPAGASPRATRSPSLPSQICQFLATLEQARRRATRRRRLWGVARRTSNTRFYRRRIAHLRRLGRLLETIEPSVVLLLAAALHREGKYPRRLPEATRVRFNRRVVGGLLAGTAEPGQLIASVLGARELPAQARYNLACYLSALAQTLALDASRDGTVDNERSVLRIEADKALDLSLDSLRRGFQGMETADRGRLLGWAPKDPSLRHLRRERADQFNDVLSLFTQVPDHLVSP
ncbi:MAG TPA: hypothetical protein VF711_02125, partial [Acidimicrobiales bacterium]